VRFFIDCVIDFKIEEIEGVIQRSIRVQRANFPIRDTRWYNFEVAPNGRFVLQPTLYSLGGGKKKGKKGKIEENGESEYGNVDI
jgi:KaiC/GvpD/RAD55 family RecA-like ATPase